MSIIKIRRIDHNAQGESTLYELTQKAVKNIHERIRPDGPVAVHLPFWTILCVPRQNFSALPNRKGARGSVDGWLQKLKWEHTYN